MRSEQIFLFGDFELNSAKRLLLKQGKSIPLNSKVFDLLSVLVEKNGQIVTKDELLERVWENQFVEENNLTVQMSTLRKILKEKKGEHKFIVTIPGQGYKFVARINGSNDLEKIKNKGLAISNVENDAVRIVSNISFELDGDLVGRGDELEAILSLVRHGSTDLITLTGTGGAGKTSLAKAVGNELRKDFADGVYLVDLAVIHDEELLVPTIMQTLCVDESADQALVKTLTQYLRERQILIILDNFEQIISAAPIVKNLLNLSAGLKILITSRIALRFGTETEFVVKPLDVPPAEADLSLDKIQGFSAIELFINKAKTAKRHFALNKENASAVAGICRKLDGLPLAIELAAVRVRLLSPQSIFTRLQYSLDLLTRGNKDLPERQRTMRETIRWSYDLLKNSEKILFRRLAVFIGSFTIEAAEAICEETSTSKPELTTLDILDSLIDNNLLTCKEQKDGSVRLRMLEVVREFAFEMIEESGELNDLRKYHAEFFLGLSEEAEMFLQGDEGNEWLGKIADEYDNFRDALGWSTANSSEKAVRIAAALRYFWLSRGHLSEGLQWSNTILGATENTISEARFKLLMANGMFLRQQGNLEVARKVYEEALKEGREINDVENIIKVNQGLSAIAVLEKDFKSAKAFCEEALALCRTIKNEMMTAYILGSLGDLELSKGNPTFARPYIEECLDLSEKHKNRRVLMTMYFNLGSVDYLENKYEKAAENFTRSLRIAQEMENKTMISCSFDGFAAIATSMGDLKQAVYLAGAAEGLRDKIGYKIEPAEEIFREDYLSKINAALSSKDFAQLYAQGKTMDPEECVKRILLNGNSEVEDSSTNENTFEIRIEQHKIERIIIEEGL